MILPCQKHVIVPWLRAAALAGVVVTVVGCSWVGGIEPTDISSVKPGAGREQVERALGEPIKRVKTSSGETATYAYDRGAPGQNPRYFGYALPILPILLLGAAVTGHESEFREEQRGIIEITYDNNGTLVSCSAPGSQDRFAYRMCEAYSGDIERQWEYGRYLVTVKDKAGFFWIYKAANCRSSAAQLTLGHYYHYYIKTHFGESPDYRSAYMWYAIARANGEQGAATYQNNIATKLDNGEIAEVERRAAAWSPDPAVCEGDVAAAGSGG